MKLMVEKGEKMPSLYADSAYGKLNHWSISTSNLSSEYFENWGWGEVCEDGIGVSDYRRLCLHTQTHTCTHRHTLAHAAALGEPNCVRIARPSLFVS